MRSLLLILALTACSFDERTGGDTLGYGTLTNVTWGAGLCPAGFFCAGSLRIGVSGFDARIGDTDVIAQGELSQATRDQLDDFVAAIPLSLPTGVFMDDGLDSGRVELDISRGEEILIYYSNGFRGELGIYLADLRTAISTCSTDVAYSSCTPQP